jgi:hypothetical protein
MITFLYEAVTFADVTVPREPTKRQVKAFRAL